MDLDSDCAIHNNLQVLVTQVFFFERILSHYLFLIILPTFNMRFTSLIVLSAAAVASVSAIAIPKHLGQHVEHAVQAAEHIVSSLDGRDIFTPSPHQPGSDSGSSLGIGRIPSPEHRPSSNQQQTEHVNRIKQEMKTNGATHATVEHLAHSTGSKDPNVHITATFQKAQQASNGGIHKECRQVPPLNRNGLRLRLLIA
ncbi:hypothetical protein BJ165DRAFT_846354 [Panaeolus papilionaceus]|nr:hypothetical protein BJ165DRAFT_846354 [Panaeolus papilionaceus]